MQDTLVRMGTSLEITRGGPEIVAWSVPLPGASLDPLVGWMNGQGRKTTAARRDTGSGGTFRVVPRVLAREKTTKARRDTGLAGVLQTAFSIFGGGRLQAVIDLSSRERV